MSEPKRIKPVKVGRHSVRLYHMKAERGRAERWAIADYTSGRRVLRYFGTEREARAEGLLICHKLAAGDAAGASLTGEDRAEIIRARAAVERHGMSVQAAVEAFSAAADAVGPHNVVAACEAHAKRNPASRERLAVETAVAAYLEAKATKGRSQRHLADMRARLGRLAADHPGRIVSEFDGPGLQKWLDGLRSKSGEPMAPLTRRNFATVVSGFFKHLHRRGAIAENPCEALEREGTGGDSDVEFWTAGEAARLLEAVDPVVMPALVLGIFSGVRVAEIERLRWSAVNLERGHVEIGAEIAKTGSRRLAPIPANAVQWLAPLARRPKDAVFPESSGRISELVTKAAERAGVRRISNGARHSFVSHRVALIENMPAVALEVGNSPAVVARHYRGLVGKAEAEAFFGIFPPAMAGNVVPMGAASRAG